MLFDISICDKINYDKTNKCKPFEFNESVLL